ncbi:MAG: hypothetical protein INR62_08540 [Rhodospirillales bacterium]|nr:hypothetical protein [Acetobacter sp.]
MDETLSGRPGSGGRPLLAASPLAGADADRTKRASIRGLVVCGVGATRSHSCDGLAPTMEVVLTACTGAVRLVLQRPA